MELLSFYADGDQLPEPKAWVASCWNVNSFPLRWEFSSSVERDVFSSQHSAVCVQCDEAGGPMFGQVDAIEEVFLDGTLARAVARVLALESKGFPDAGASGWLSASDLMGRVLLAQGLCASLTPSESADSLTHGEVAVSQLWGLANVCMSHNVDVVWCT